LKRFLQEEKDEKIVSPRDVFKVAYRDGINHEETTWLSMLKDRNLTSHTYNEKLAHPFL